MKLQGKVRRILAMLLVLIFAMSNIGLAEMDVQLDELFETAGEEPEVVEEPAAEVAAEAEPAEAEEAPEAEAAEEVAEVEAAEPVLKNLGVVAIDECTLIAEAEVENYEGELAWQWQSAAPAEEPEFVDIEGATGAELNLTDDARYENIYRCVVAAGEVRAATEAASFPMAEAEIAEEVVEAPAEETEVGSEEAAEAPAEEAEPELFAEIAEEPVEEHPVFVEEPVEAETFDASQTNPEKVNADTDKTCVGGVEHKFSETPLTLAELARLGIPEAEGEHYLLCTVCEKYYREVKAGEASACAYKATGVLEDEHDPKADKCIYCGKAHGGEETFDKFTQDGDEHYKVCPVCGGKTEPAPHRFAEVSEGIDLGAHKDTCEDCKKEFSATEADFKCVPMKGSEPAKHVTICTICGNATKDSKDGEAHDNKGANNTCEACGYELSGSVTLTVSDEIDVGEVVVPELDYTEPDGYTYKSHEYALEDPDGAFEKQSNFANEGGIKATGLTNKAKLTVTMVFEKATEPTAESDITRTASVDLTTHNALATIALTLDGEKITKDTDITLITNATTFAKKEVTLGVEMDPADALNFDPADEETGLEWKVDGDHASMVSIAGNGDTATITADQSEAVTEKQTITVTVSKKDVPELTASCTITVLPELKTADLGSDITVKEASFTSAETAEVTIAEKDAHYAVGEVTIAANDGTELGEGKAAKDFVTYDPTTKTLNPVPGAAFGKGGKTFKISVAYTDFEDAVASTTFTIKQAPAGIKIVETGKDAVPATLLQTATLNLTASFEEGSDTDTQVADIKWTSDNDKVKVVEGPAATTTVTVDADAEGKANITASVVNVSKTITIEILPLPTLKLSVKPGMEKLAVGETTTVSAEIGNVTGENPDIEWTVTGNLDAKTTEAKGKLELEITGKDSNGSGQVKATLPDPAKGGEAKIEATLDITVLKAPESADNMTITVADNKTELAVGETATVTFGYASNYGVRYNQPTFAAAGDTGAIKAEQANPTEKPDEWTITATKAGTATITMTAWNSTAEKKIEKTQVITVKDEVKEITVPEILSKDLVMGEKETVTIKKDDVKLFTAWTDAETNTLASAEYSWKLTVPSSASTYVGVEETEEGDWTITAKKQTGSANVTLKVEPNIGGGSVSKSVKVIIKKAPTDIKLSVDKAELIAGETAKLTANLGGSAYAANVAYTIDDDGKQVVEVAADGTVKALKAGEAVITATIYNGAFDEFNDDPALKNLTASVKMKVYAAAQSSTTISAIETDAKDDAIGYQQSTNLTANFSDGSMADVSWKVTDDKATVTKTGRNTAKLTAKANTEGEITVTATATVVTKAAMGDTPAETKEITLDKKVTVLTKVGKVEIAKEDKASQMALGETLSFHVQPTADDTGNAKPDGTVVKDNYTGLFTVTAKPSKNVTIQEDENGVFNVTAKKAGKVTLTASAKGGAKTSMTVTVSSKKLTKLALSASKLTIAKGESATLNPVYTPATKAVPNLKVAISCVGTDKKLEQIEYKNKKVTIKEGATTGDVYTLTFSVGYSTIDAQTCEVTVTDPATDTAASGMKLTLTKVAGEDFGGEDKTAASAKKTIEITSDNDNELITLGQNEKLKVETSFGGNYSSAVTLKSSSNANASVKSGIVTPKKVGKTVTITASTAAGAELKFRVKVAAKAKSVTISPSATTVNLGVDEKYVLKVTGSRYSGNGKWFKVTNDDGITVADTTTAEDKNYVYTITGATADTKSVFAIDPYTGSTKKVTFNVKPKLENVDIIVPNDVDKGDERTELTLAKGDTLTLKADMNGGYGALTWTVSGVEVKGSKKSPTKIDAEGVSKVTAYKVSNTEIAIVAGGTANVPEDGLKIKVAANGYEPAVESSELPVKLVGKFVKGDLTKLSFEKDVIAVGQTVQAAVEMKAGVDPKERGALKWSAKPSSVASVDGNGVVTAKKAGKVTITATAFNNKNYKVSKTLNVITNPSKLAISMPETMYPGETITVPLTISGMAKGKTSPKSLKVTAELIDELLELDATADGKTAADSEDIITIKVEDGNSANVKNVTFQASAKAVKDEKAAISLSTYYAKLKPVTGEIKIVNAPTTIAITENGTATTAIRLAPNTSTQLGVSFGADAGAAVTWSVDGNKNVTVANGKVSVKKGATGKATITATANCEVSGKPLSTSVELTVLTAPKSSDITIEVPKTTLVAGEKLTASASYSGGYDGQITWSSSNTKKLKVLNSKTGEFQATTSAKTGTAKITAKLSYYNNKTKKTASVSKTLTIHFKSAPASLSFLNSDPIGVIAGMKVDLDVSKPSKGVEANDDSKETLFSFKARDGVGDDKLIQTLDEQTGELTINTSADIATKGAEAIVDLLLLGNEKKVVDSITLVVVAEPKSIELMWKGETIDDSSNPVTIAEGETMTPVYAVKDDSSDEIEDAQVTWTIEDDDTATENITINPYTGQVSAKHYTADTETVKVVATCGDATASYKVVVTPTRKAAYITAEALKETIGKGETVKVTLGYNTDAAEVAKVFEGYTLGLATSNKSYVSVTPVKGEPNAWNVKGEAVGKSAELTISATKDKDVISRKVTVSVKAGATGLTIAPATETTLTTVGIGETIALVADLTDYKGTINDETFTLATKSTADAGKVDIVEGEDHKSFTVAYKPEDNTGAKVALTLTSPVLDKTAEIEVEFKAAPTSITVTPAKGEKTTLSAGQSVKLTAAYDVATALWTQGIVWAADEPNKDNVTFTAVEGDPMSIIATTAAAMKDGTVKITASLKGSDSVKSAERTITVKAAPAPETIDEIVEKYTVGKPRISLGETTTVGIEFKAGKDCDLLNWKVDDETIVDIAKDGEKYVVTPKAVGKVTLTAVAYNEVELVSATLKGVTIEVVDTPTGVELNPVPKTLTKGQAMAVSARAFKEVADGDATTKVTVAADCQLTSSNQNVTVKAGTAANTWTITAGDDATGMVILTVSANDGAVSKSYSVKVDGEKATVTALDVNVSAYDTTALTGEAAANAAYNKSVSVIKKTDNNVTITAPVAALKAFALTEQGEKKQYVGVKVSTTDESSTFEGATINGGTDTIDKIANVTDIAQDNKSFVLWVDANECQDAPYIAEIKTTDLKVATLIFSVVAEVKDPMNVTVTKLPKVSQTDGNTVKSEANQAAIESVVMDGDTITITGNYSAMQAFNSTTAGKGNHKWIGLEIATGTKDIKTVTWSANPGNAAFDESEVTLSKSIDLPDGSFACWLSAEELMEGEITCTIGMADNSKLPRALTFKFVDKVPEGKELELSIKLLGEKEVNQNDGNQTVSGENQKLSEIAVDGSTVTVKAPVDILNSYKNTTKAQTEGKWIGMVVELVGEETIEGVTFGEQKFAQADIDEYHTLFTDELKNKFILWVKTSDFDGGDLIIPMTKANGDGTIAKSTTLVLKLEDTTPDVYVIPQDHNLGKWKKDVSELVSPETKIDPATGAVTGKLYYISGWTEFDGSNAERQSGNYIAVRFSERFLNKTIKVTKKDGSTNSLLADTVANLDWIIRVPDKESTFQFAVDGGSDIITLNFANAELENVTDFASVIKAGEEVDLLGKSPADLVGDDIAIGADGSVTGTMYYINDYTGFSKSEEMHSGHYIGVRLDERFANKKLTVTGLKNGAVKQLDLKDDLDLLLRLTSKESGYKFSDESGKQLFVLSFQKATFGTVKDVTEHISVIPQEHNLGKYKKDVKELVSADSAIDAKGAVTGSLKYITGWTEFSENVANQKGYYVPVRLDERYLNKTVKVTGANTTTQEIKTNVDLDFILRVDNQQKKFKFEIGEQELFTLTFEGVTLEDYNVQPEVPTKATWNKTTSDLQRNVTIDEATKKISGMLLYTQQYNKNNPESKLDDGYYLILDVHYVTPGTMTCQAIRDGEPGNAVSVRDGGEQVVIRVKNPATQTVKFTYTKGEAQPVEIEYDLSGLVLAAPMYVAPASDETTKYYEKTAKELYEGLTLDWTVDGNTATCKVTGTSKKITEWNELTPATEKSGNFVAFSFDSSTVTGKKFVWYQSTTGFDDMSEAKGSTDAAGADECSWVLKINTYKYFKFEIGEGAEMKTIKLDFKDVNCAEA